MLFTFEWTCLAFLDLEMIVVSTEMIVAWALICMHRPMSNHVWSFCKEWCTSFQSPLKVLGCSELSSLSHSARRHKFAITRLMFKLSFRMLWTDPNEISSMLISSHMLLLLFSWTYYFTQPVCFAHRQMPWAFSIFSRDYATCKLRKPCNNLCISHFILPRAYF